VPGMIRALLWKEWREQRGVVAAGLILVVLAPLGTFAWSASRSNPLSGDDHNQLLGLFFVLFLWPLFAAACGAGTVANEHATGSLGYLLSRPIARWKIIGGKTVTALFSWIVIVGGSLAAMLVVASLTGSGTTRWFHKATQDVDNVGVVVLAVAASLLIFACAMYFSNVMRRTMTVAAAAIVAALALMTLVGFYLMRLDPSVAMDPGILGWQVIAFSAIFAVGAGYLFSSGELLRGAVAKRRALGIAAVLLILPVTVALIGGWRAVRFDIDSAVMYGMHVTPSGESVLLEMTNAAGRSPQVWSFPVNGEEPTSLTPRWSMSPHITADGRHVLFANALNRYGFWTQKLRIGEVTIDGKERRWLPGTPGLNLNGAYGGSLSPDGQWILLGNVAAFSVSLIERDSGERLDHDLSRHGFRWGYPVGWTSDSSAVLLITTLRKLPGSSTEETGRCLVRIDVRSGEMTVLHNAGSAELLSGRWIGSNTGPGGLVGNAIPLLVAEDLDADAKKYRFLLVDSDDGATEQLFDAPCGGHFALDEAKTTMAYHVCLSDEREGQQTLLLRRLDDGSTQSWGTVGGPIGSLMLSPDGKRLVVARQNQSWIVVREDGSQKEIKSDKGWPSGWTADGRLLETTWDGEVRELRVRDLVTGELNVLFPRGES